MVWWSSPYETLYLASKVTTYWLMINFLDFAPNSMRRRILSNEYSGDTLEKRLNMKIGGGWRVFAALWKMSRINLFPLLKVGDMIPKGNLYVHNIQNSKEKTDLFTICQENKIVVLNFGSCS